MSEDRGRPPAEMVQRIVSHNCGAPWSSIGVIVTEANYDGTQVQDVLDELEADGEIVKRDEGYWVADDVE